MILNMTGGGAGLNFKVSAYAELPETGKENEIAVITDAPITSWVFSPAEPEAPEEGMVWFSLGNNSPVPFNALKKNGIEVFPTSALQYADGAWVSKEARTYTAGEWKEWTLYLFNRGNVNTELTGGINGTIQDGALYYTGTVSKSTNHTYTTKAAIDLTDINTVKAKMLSSNTLEYIYFRLTATKKAYDGGGPATSDLTKYISIDSPFTGKEVEVTLDVSSLSGEYYLGYAWGVLSTAGGSRTITGYITEWWIE